MDIIRLFTKQIKAHPITIIFFIIGYFISMLTISVGISNKVNINDMIIEGNNGVYKNSVDVQFNMSKDIKYNDVLINFKDISKGSKIVINSLSAVVGKNNSEVKLIAEFFKSSDGSSIYPLIKGRLYTSKEIENKNKVVVVGKELQNYIINKDNISYINIAGCDYKVIGIVGHTQRPSLWDKTILIPATSVPESSKTSYLMMHSGSFMLISEDNMEGTDYKSIINNFKKMDSESSVNAERTEESNNAMLDSVMDESKLFYVAAIIFAFSIINIINISSFWINERKVEIGIKKAFG
ncbi:ABC transporter permease [Inconstantimicrobium porci]|uniref:ABC transporter permease n=1 Tax=Inconstantimicrobium porci TaxID=2652291 RepID=UPI002409EE94|nr:ABC transporter permease [Inconstantimicrobium porci]MDD6772319.1 ABC transporter permease [Inconstantimicrobium porci]